MGNRVLWFEEVSTGDSISNGMPYLVLNFKPIKISPNLSNPQPWLADCLPWIESIFTSLENMILECRPGEVKIWNCRFVFGCVEDLWKSFPVHELATCLEKDVLMG